MPHRSHRRLRFWPIVKISYVGLAVIAVASLAVVALAHGNVTARAAAGPIPTFTSQPVAHTVSVAVIGDSYTACSPMGGCGDTNYLLKLHADLGWQFKPFAVGGTGYVNNLGGKTTFGQRVDDVIATKPDVVVVEGGRNDADMLDQLPAAVTDTLTRLKAGLPDAKLIVVGPIVTITSKPSSTEARDIISSAATAVGVTAFVDPIADGWFTGADADLIGSDGVHPTDAGHVYMAQKIEPVLRTAIPQ